MDLYYKEIRKYNLLTPEEEQDLWVKYRKEESLEARQELIKAYQPLVFKVVRHFNSKREILMDLIQEGNIGLIQAVDSFEAERGSSFASFASKHIRGRVLDYLRKGNRPLPEIRLLSHEYLEREIEVRCLVDRVRAVLEELPGKERTVIEGIYLADKNASLLAREMGISLSYLYRLQKKAIRRMRGKLSRFIKEWG
ncbi:MAG: sigma-70 family RNA polymerase sigma factor [Halanaerobiaceae bacterium]|nr:sigma-70 family RNA polymerase sigma factor [Halanaerobiaceae bacterium]